MIAKSIWVIALVIDELRYHINQAREEFRLAERRAEKVRKARHDGRTR